VIALVAWGFAYLYVFVQVLVPGSFAAVVEPGNDRTWIGLTITRRSSNT
jgi:hypothetical protein